MVGSKDIGGEFHEIGNAYRCEMEVGLKGMRLCIERGI